MKSRVVFLFAILVIVLLTGVFLAKSLPRSSSSAAQSAPAAEDVSIPNSSPATPPQTAAAHASTSAPVQVLATAPPLVQATPGRPGAQPVPDTLPPMRNAPAPLPIPADFLDRIVSGGSASFALPGGGQATGTVDLIERDAHGISTVQGRLEAPQSGFYFFHRESEPGVAGAFFGNVRFDEGPVAYRLEPIGPGGSTLLVPRRIDEVICVGMPAPPEENDSPVAAQANDDASLEDSGTAQEAPQTHPTNIPIPPSQNTIVPLQSLPGATAVIFLDFEGGPGPWPGWNPSNFVAEPANVSTSQIKEVWQRVSEDYQPFNINVTTDRKVFEAAPLNSRQRVMITPTKTVAPTAGGVALGGSFNSSSDSVCWSFYTSGKSSAEVIAHEVGHTLRLAHDGRDLPDQDREDYYGGHGSGDTGWAPIMGVGYYEVLTQWSKGEYAYATNTQDDLAIFTNNNNNVDYRADDFGGGHADSGYLEIFSDNTVSNEGIIEQNTDVDALRFTTTGGSVSFTVTRVAIGPNLDIVASIHDSAGTQIASDNPVDGLSATVSANLAAGDYTLRVTGTGKGDPTTDYSGYASLGAYIITGNAGSGSVKPLRFSVPENSPNESSVGTVTPRKNHGISPVTYAIASGNVNNAFSINPTTGAISVSNSSTLNYETLSTQWDDPATIPIFVSITDSTNPSLNESIRVVVTVTDVNEAPTLSAGSKTIFSRTRIGTVFAQAQSSDPDRFDFPTFSIVGGNAGGLFAIDPATGELSVAGALNVTQSTVHTLTIRATDQLSPAQTTDANFSVTVLPLAGQYMPGTISLTYYENISGNPLSNLTSNAKFPDNPDSLEYATQLEVLGHGDNYGSVFRGYLLIPATGNYTFRLAADDSAVLYISTTTDPANNLQRGNGISSATGYRQYGSSASINNLQAGTVRYIEVRHKEGVGDDHVTVAWEGPGIPLQVIPGAYLAPYSKNYAPKVSATSLSVREDANPGTVLGTPTVTDLNEEDTFSHAITGGTGASRFGIDSATGRIFVTNPAGLTAGSSYTLQIQVTDSGSPALSATGTVTVGVTSATAININGIARQIWNNFTGNLDQFNSIAGYPHSPDETQILTSFDTGAGTAPNYASRTRACIVPPTTGIYRFYIASDNNSRLLLSTDENPTNATIIASVSNYVSRYDYTAQSSQTSATKSLVAGQRYYVEVLHRQGPGDEHLEVAWTGPDISSPTIIPGSALQPYNINTAPAFAGAPYNFAMNTGANNGTVVGMANAADPEGDALLYTILGGNSSGAFAIDPVTGRITVANRNALVAGSTILTLGVQDQGIDNVYPLGKATATATITVSQTLEGWRQSTFGADAGNPLIAGNSADPDSDGIPNIAEYALGLRGVNPDILPLQLTLARIGEDEFLRITVQKDPNATGVNVFVEASGNLSNNASWSTSGTTVEQNTATTLQVRDNTPVDSAGRRFLRLRVTVP